MSLENALGQIGRELDNGLVRTKVVLSSITTRSRLVTGGGAVLLLTGGAVGFMYQNQVTAEDVARFFANSNRSQATATAANTDYGINRLNGSPESTPVPVIPTIVVPEPIPVQAPTPGAAISQTEDGLTFPTAAAVIGDGSRGNGGRLPVDFNASEPPSFMDYQIADCGDFSADNDGAVDTSGVLVHGELISVEAFSAEDLRSCLEGIEGTRPFFTSQFHAQDNGFKSMTMESIRKLTVIDFKSFTDWHQDLLPELKKINSNATQAQADLILASLRFAARNKDNGEVGVFTPQWVDNESDEGHTKVWKGHILALIYDAATQQFAFVEQSKEKPKDCSNGSVPFSLNEVPASPILTQSATPTISNTAVETPNVPATPTPIATRIATVINTVTATITSIIDTATATATKIATVVVKTVTPTPAATVLPSATVTEAPTQPPVDTAIPKPDTATPESTVLPITATEASTQEPVKTAIPKPPSPTAESTVLPSAIATVPPTQKPVDTATPKPTKVPATATPIKVVMDYLRQLFL